MQIKTKEKYKGIKEMAIFLFKDRIAITNTQPFLYFLILFKHSKIKEFYFIYSGTIPFVKLISRWYIYYGVL